MNCSECQNQIFDGELDRAAVVHLTECEECRALDREVKLNSAALADLREEVIPICTPRRRLPWAVGAGAVAAAAVIVAMIAWPNPPAPQAPKAPIATLQPPPVAPVLPEIAFAKVALPAPRRIHRPSAAKPKPEQPQEQLFVKFFTDDPDVVIYWLIDSPKGEVGL